MFIGFCEKQYCYSGAHGFITNFLVVVVVSGAEMLFVNNQSSSIAISASIYSMTLLLAEYNIYLSVFFLFGEKQTP